MNTPALTGAVLSVIGTAGYVAGIAVSYPGRAFSLTAIMIGITFVLVARNDGRANV